MLAFLTAKPSGQFRQTMEPGSLILPFPQAVQLGPLPASRSQPRAHEGSRVAARVLLGHSAHPGAIEEAPPVHCGPVPPQLHRASVQGIHLDAPSQAQ